MPSLHVVYDCIGWAYYHRASALQKYAPPGWSVTIGDQQSAWQPADVVLWLPYGSLPHIGSLIGMMDPKPILVGGHNCGLGYRRENLDACLQFADWVVVNNRENWEGIGKPAKTSWISNGVDLEVFKPIVPQEQRKPKVLSIGSTYHLRHNDDLKGLFSHLGHLGIMLASDGIDFDWKITESTKPETLLDQAAMNAWYNTGTIYLVASRHEGTPNPALEAAASGCVIVSTRVGNMPELILPGRNGRLVDRDIHTMYGAIKQCTSNYRMMACDMLAQIQSWHWGERAKQYFTLFDRLLESKP